MKDESLHIDQHDANVISPVLNSSDEVGQENDKAGDNSYDEPAMRVSENLETSSTKKEDKRHKSRKRKRKSLSSSPEIVKRSNKKKRKKSRSRRENRKRWPSSSSFSSSSSSTWSTKSENEIVDKRFKIVPKGEEFKLNLPSSMADSANLENTVGFTNGYHDLSSHGKVFGKIFAGYWPVITTLERIGRCSK